MNLRRVRIADRVTGACGLALLLLLWAPWYAVSDGSLNAWSALGLIDLWLALTALLAISVPIVTAARDTTAVPVAVDVVCAVVATLALLLVLLRLLFVPDGDVVTGRDWGVWLGALATLGLFAAAWLAVRDESAPRLRPAPAPERLAVPPPGRGPEPVARDI
jgi:hypothetical protein